MKIYNEVLCKHNVVLNISSEITFSLAKNRKNKMSHKYNKKKRKFV